MENTPVYIFQGDHANIHGKVKSLTFDHATSTSYYLIEVPERVEEWPAGYVISSTPAYKLKVPATDCALYFYTNTYVRIDGDLRGVVKSYNFDRSTNTYDMTVFVSADEYGYHWSDYLPSDQTYVLPAHRLSFA